MRRIGLRLEGRGADSWGRISTFLSCCFGLIDGLVVGGMNKAECINIAAGTDKMLSPARDVS